MQTFSMFKFCEVCEILHLYRKYKKKPLFSYLWYIFRCLLNCVKTVTRKRESCATGDLKTSNQQTKT